MLTPFTYDFIEYCFSLGLKSVVGTFCFFFFRMYPRILGGLGGAGCFCFSHMVERLHFYALKLKFDFWGFLWDAKVAKRKFWAKSIKGSRAVCISYLGWVEYSVF